MHPWAALLLAGVFEIGFTLNLKLSEGFSKISYTIAFLVCAVISFYFLSQAIKVIPLGTAYAVWTGIGAAGTVILGMIFFKEPASLIRIFLITVLMLTIVGLKMFAPEGQ